ncbi:S8 family serine peptidase [Bradyrhizobium sp. 1]|uniref:S8 family serine peptidase n=1 Tax=Bradyrhizobium sp. 1 TaxID=241591 RepID=UPI0023EF0DAE|nr:S8 family serine peptidase [Bradyrhizobium sp. 1]
MAYKGSARFPFFDLDTPFYDLQFSFSDPVLGNILPTPNLNSSIADPIQPASNAALDQLSSNFNPNQPVIFPPPPVLTPLQRGDWYLENVGQDLGTPGQDLNVKPVWQDYNYTGKGVHVGIFDSGVQGNHPDLAASITGIPGTNIPSYSPTAAELGNSDNAHGTQVAGIIAAANDGVGATGIAYDAKITGVAFDVGGQTDYGLLNYFKNFDVTSNSWTDRHAFGLNYNHLPQISGAVFVAVTAGRGGLGTIIVAGAGNDREGGSEYVRDVNETEHGVQPFFATDVNAENFNSDPRVITVGAVDHNGNVLDYSTPGAALLVSAFSGLGGTTDNNQRNGTGTAPDGKPHVIGTRDGVLSTDLLGWNGYNNNPSGGLVDGDYALFTGTSAATPEVAGVVALMLQANPDLGWRDVRDILALTARHTGSAINAAPTGSEKYIWTNNGADEWNGGGLHFSNDYGFGTVDAKAAVSLAETWTEQSVSSNQALAVGFFHQPLHIADASYVVNAGGVVHSEEGVTRFSINIADDIKIEDLTLTLTSSHANVSDLTIVLTSPDGTRSMMLDQVDNADYQAAIVHGNVNPIAFPTSGWTMTSNQFAGELSAGTWTVAIIDHNIGYTGDITGARLNIFGSADTTNDTYVFTDEFGTLGNDPKHGFVMLDNDGGIDTINAAAVSTASIIDLENGHYRIAGREYSGGWGTADDFHLHLIENVIGGDGGDTLGGNEADNHLQGMRGDDTLRGYEGNDTLDGGVGNDNLDGGIGDDILIGGAGADILTGGDGFDTASYSTSSAAVNVNLATGTGLEGDAEGDHLSGIEHIIGSLSGDQLIADSLGDTLDGNAGDDVLLGGAGNDTLNGGQGDDSLRGRAGNDTLDGGVGNDHLDGGTGDDTLIGGAGADVLIGGNGYDTADYSASLAVNVNLATGIGLGGDAEGDHLSGIEHIYGSRLDDTLTADSRGDTLDGNAGNDVLTGGAGNDTLNGGRGDDMFMVGQGGVDHIDGGLGTDTENFSQSASAIWAQLDSADSSAGPGWTPPSDPLATGHAWTTSDDSLWIANYTGHFEGIAQSIGVENIIGSQFNDILEGDNGDNVIIGGLGDDELYGMGGADTYIGGTSAHSSIFGIGGDDLVGYWYAGSAVTVDLENDSRNTGDAADDRFYGIKGLGGSFYDDALYGTTGNNVLMGEAGADILDGREGEDTASYRWAIEGVTANLAHPELNTGDAKGDAYISIEDLQGSYFNDTLTGDAGDNRIQGLNGQDTLTGGGGDDTFVFAHASDIGGGATGTASDVITDFSAGDIIDLSGIDAIDATGPKDSFSLIGDAAFSGHAGELRTGQDHATGMTYVQGDTNGDGIADFQLNLSNPYHLAASDFRFTPPAPDISGKAEDGYLAGATIFADTNHDHVLSPHEAATTTDGQGNFTLAPGDAPLIAIGGTDIATGLAFKGFLSAPSGATVITPLTTLVQVLTESGVADPLAKVLQVFHLPAGTDLLHIDPVAMAAAGDPSGFNLLAAAAGVMSDVALIAAGLEGQSNMAPMAAATSAFAAVASVISGNSSIDPTDAGLLGQIVTLAGLTGEFADSVTQALVSINGQILAAPNTASLIAIQTHAQGDLADSIATPAAPTLTLAHDSGASSTDHITSNATIAVVAAPAGETLAYTVDGSVVASYDPAGLTQGVHHVSVTQTNAAGYVSAAGEIDFTYDTVAPGLALAAPTGPIITDRPTEIFGTAGLEDSGRTVQISEGGSVLGTAIVGSDGSWHADVMLHGVGDHTLVASATDLAGNTDQLSTTLAAAANGLPTAGGDHLTAREHTPLVTSAADLLANDTDPDGDTLNLVSVGHATHGNVVFDAAHETVTFTPDAGYSGAAAFDYTISDGHGGLATGTVGVNVKSGSTGGGWGDVHYTSFDGFKFNLQSTGDYVIAHATSGPEFEVDGRAENLGHTGVSYLTAVAVEAGDHLIVFDEAKPSTMLVDGHAVTFAVGDRLDLGDGVVIGRATATTHQIETPLDFVDMLDHGSYLDLSVHAGSAREPGSFEGLLGNLDGNAKNDFGLANGTWLANPNAKVIEGLFADAWRVGPQDNMLASLGHETFTQRLSDATHDHASAISVHDWHII